ncbi:sigma factor-like helix-turn-helix DNA-binding protein, partial [Streptomyces meridianus]|nr:hypothetical protein [Streptomyces meridianus]
MHLSGADSPPARPAPAKGPAEAFDALYTAHAPGIVRQAYLLTGRRAHARRAARYAFETAWQHWPEVAAHADPAGWARAKAYDWALSPWHRLRPSHRPFFSRGEAGPASGDPLLAALLALPPSYRRALLLHDGVGLGLSATAAEVEASAQAAASRVVNARAAVAARLPGLPGEPGRLAGMLAARLAGPPPAPAGTPETGSAQGVRA